MGQLEGYQPDELRESNASLRHQVEWTRGALLSLRQEYEALADPTDLNSHSGSSSKTLLVEAAGSDQLDELKLQYVRLREQLRCNCTDIVYFKNRIDDLKQENRVPQSLANPPPLLCRCHSGTDREQTCKTSAVGEANRGR